MSHDYRGEPRPVALAFGLALRAAREERGVSQEWLAEASGLDSTYPSMLERRLRMPTLAVVFRLADGLGINPLGLVAETIARAAGRAPRRLYCLVFRESEGAFARVVGAYDTVEAATAGSRVQNTARRACGQPQITHIAEYTEIKVTELPEGAAR